MRILHLIHSTHVGGVESAAAHLREELADHERIQYRIAVLAAADPDQAVLTADVVGSGLNSPLSVLALLRQLRRWDPDVLVTSLWRSVAVGALARALGRRRPWAIWVHNSRFTQPVDRLVHHWALPRADLVLCDSIAARDLLAEPILRRAGARHPAVLVRPDAAPLPAHTAAAPALRAQLRLVTWGRIAPQKRLDVALGVLAQLREQSPAGAHLTIIGPDSGGLADLRAEITRRRLADAVTLTGPADRAAIARAAAEADVFIQTSEFEGYAMAAHEALAAGMVSLLTPVGDLASDTRDGDHALHHHGDAARSAARLLELAEDPAAWAEMSHRARHVRTTAMADEFAAACEVLA
ncbi:glycosyltransferase family 4 protein [Brachybacterium sp. GCM10030267]|uniref:glycosyltransferase family 4 protein n=1 Tax=Brachybacterium sp. GCM10030267 TaxID=3273381 RepID=UPI00361D6365